jgi:beta-lactamase class D
MLIIKAYLLFLSIAFTIQVKAQTDFDQVDGSITIYDSRKKSWFYSDSLDARRTTLPASTFKILNSLIALETGAIKDEKQILKWDGIPKTFLGTDMILWNKDSDLKSAYKNSTNWFYVELAKRIKKKNYRKYLQACEYGNLDLSEKGNDFWNYGNFGVSPVNQIMFLRKLYQNKLPFSKKHIAIVKEIMISEQTGSYILRDKTGLTRKDGQDIGWWIGYIETKNNVFFFATRLIKSTMDHNPHFTFYRKEMTRHILAEICAVD